ncbi:MAG: DUF4824 family protein, partial [Gammaproteobacteria bacterium]|nr:DUF4824 family protein [Gammaproteobacteria bacterium]
MMKWSHTLIAGGAIILLTNAVALGGVAYNRSGEPESQLQLTQRELNRSYTFSRKDNSGITLSLNWRFEQAELNEYNLGMYSGRWGNPVWLDKDKLVQLGFDVEKLAATQDYRQRNKEFQPKEVLLVLELDDRAYRHHLQRTREYLEESRRLLAASPANTEMQRKAKSAEENYKSEVETGSRLFVIDAGLDLDALRAAYPDHKRYAILHGLIRPADIHIKNQTVIGGNISELHAGLINVPLDKRQVLSGSDPYEVTVAFGKRLEPWIIS